MHRPRNTALKIAGIALTVGLLGGALTGCGGSDSDGDAAADAPKGASKDGFCEKFNSLYEDLAGLGGDDTAEAIKGVKAWAAEIEDYGTPDEMSDEVRKGFEVVVGTFKTVDDDATAEDLQKLGGDLSAEDNKAAEAFGAWSTENCPTPDLPGAPSDSAS